MDLKSLRDELDETDRQLVALAARRQQIVARIGASKRARGTQLRDYAREREVLDKASANAREQGLDDALARQLLALLIEASLTAQEDERVRLGGQGAGQSALVIGGGGRMGRWFARFLEAQGFRITVADPAGSPEGFSCIDDWRQGIETAALIVISTPLRISNAILNELCELRPAGLLVDIGSLKAPLQAALERAREAGLRVASLHPLFGPSAAMLAGRHVVHVDLGDPAALAESQALFASTMAGNVVMSLHEHDRLMAWVLGLGHALNIAFAAALADSGESVHGLGEIASTTFAQQLQIARNVVAENPALYYEIQHENPHGGEARKALQRALQSLVDAVDQHDESTFEQMMTQAHSRLQLRHGDDAATASPHTS